jgi:hypothetical protein
MIDLPPTKFQDFRDWFFTIHIDPVQRWIHTIGMFIGSYFFIIMWFQWNLLTLVYYLLGVFFFYGLGIISHRLYDGGVEKSYLRFFHKTLFYVLEINFLTLFGLYDKRLRNFLQKYPDLKNQLQLVEVSPSNFISYISRRHKEGKQKQI